MESKSKIIYSISLVDGKPSIDLKTNIKPEDVEPIMRVSVYQQYRLTLHRLRQTHGGSIDLSKHIEELEQTLRTLKAPGSTRYTGIEKFIYKKCVRVCISYFGKLSLYSGVFEEDVKGCMELLTKSLIDDSEYSLEEFQKAFDRFVADRLEIEAKKILGREELSTYDHIARPFDYPYRTRGERVETRYCSSEGIELLTKQLDKL